MFQEKLMDTRESAWILWEKALTCEKNKMCQNEFTMKEIHWLRVLGRREDHKLSTLFFVGKRSCHLKTGQI